MGFGYNGELTKAGERLDMLDFFAWMKRLQRLGVEEWNVWDAAGYWIVNKTPKKKIEKLGKNPRAADILEVLIAEQDRPKRREIKDNCDLRSQYLQRLIAATGVEAKYFDSRKVMRDDPRFVEAFDTALEYEKELPFLLRNIICPKTDNPARELYLPLEMAEALYLEMLQDVSGKYGPETERFFDAGILRMMQSQGKPYVTIRSPQPPDETPVGYLANRWFDPTPAQGLMRGTPVACSQDDQFRLERVLGKSPERPTYKAFVGQYLSEFKEEGESLIDCAQRFCEVLEEVI